MIAHSPECRCPVCRDVREATVEVIQADRNLLANLWALWISERDGEAAKLRSGEDGAVGSPRWVALQAIAIARGARIP